jgi:hypothetical protein
MKLQTISFLAVVTIATLNLRAQSVHFVKFIHVGDETKPIGTIVISIGGLVKPTDKPMDDVFGRSVQTDTGTYKALVDIIKSGKYRTPTDKLDTRDFFIIKSSDGFGLDLCWPEYKEFFNDLHSALKNRDKAVNNVFKSYYP